MQKTEIFTTQVGGQTPALRSVRIAGTDGGEQIEVLLCKRTNGNVRVTTSEGAVNANAGVQLPLDTYLTIRLQTGQRLFLVTDETVNQVSVDVIIQPTTQTKQVTDALTNLSQGISAALGYNPTLTSCPPKNYK